MAGSDPLYHDQRLAQLYDIDNGWTDDRSYCLELARSRRTVLDLGCGTGSLAVAMAETHGCEVIGVDPAGAMLDVARGRPGGGRVTWINADMRRVTLGKRFDLIVMTGHAFQCLLTTGDRIAALRTAAAHLAPEGLFIFDTRNPAREEWREWTPEKSHRVIDVPGHGETEAWNDVSFDPARQVARYETLYRFKNTGEVLRAQSEIAFPSLQDVKASLTAAGLLAAEWLGDWRGGPLTAQSPEFIAKTRHARS